MIMSDFSHGYQLSAGIERKFTEEGYTHARMLHFVMGHKMKKIAFQNGEIAYLKDAVERWCSEIAEE